MPKHQERVLGS